MAASKEERDARLNALSAAIKDWAAKRRKNLKGQVSFGKRLLKGRSGAERLNQASVESATALAVDQINDYLAG